MKKAILFTVAILMLIGMIDCSRTANPDTAESLYMETAVESTDEILSKNVRDPEEEGTEASSETFIPAASESETVLPTATITTSPPAGKTSPSTISTSSSQQLPTTSSSPPTTPAPPAPTASVYTQKDFDEIITAVREYAESQTEVNFIWKPAMKKGAGGFHNTPNLSKQGKDSVIAELKFNVDLTVKVVTDPSNGIPSYTAEYNIVWYEQDRYFFEEPGKDIYFVLLYG